MSEEIQPKIVTILPVGEERENARKLYKFTTLSMNKKKNLISLLLHTTNLIIV